MSEHTVKRFSDAIYILEHYLKEGTPGLWEFKYFEPWTSTESGCAHIITTQHGDTVAEVQIGEDHQGPRPKYDSPVADAALLVLLHNSTDLLIEILNRAREEEMTADALNKTLGTTHRGPSKIVPFNRAAYNLAEYICDWRND